LKARLPQGGPTRSLEAIPVHIKQPVHPLAALRQGRSQQRNFSTAIRRVITDVSRPIQSTRPVSGSAVRGALSRSTLAPFSSPLRPNLTGGAIPRSSGGYSIGGRVRHFSSIPAAQAHVVQNVNAAIRAFCVNGFKAHYDGTDPRTGNKKFKAITENQEKALYALRNSGACIKGTNLEFKIAPTITSISSLDMSEATLGSENVLGGLASDFSRSLSSLALIHKDLTKLSDLGSLPITYPNPYTLVVRFDGCDGKTVSNLCDELGIQRGIIREDPEWDSKEGDKDVEMALLFPVAPSYVASEIASYSIPLGPAKSLDWQSMMSPSPQPLQSPSKVQSVDDHSEIHFSQDEMDLNPWLGSSRTASYDALRESDIESNEDITFGLSLTRTETLRPIDLRTGYEGMEGILRFLEECDNARR
jgi:hypothetical protein